MRLASLAALLIPAVLLAGTAQAEGDMTKKIHRVEPLVLGTGEEDDYAISRETLTFETGKMYAFTIEAKGFKEYRFEAPEFFQNIWISQLVVDDKEIHTTSIHALEFDDTGEIEMYFIPIRPGSYGWHIEDFADKGMKGTIEVK